MSRLLSSLAISLVAVAAEAGTIQTQIGGANGLTASYISSGCSGIGPCVAGSTNAAPPSGGVNSSPVAFTEKNYDTTLFNGALNGSTAPTPYSTYSTASAHTGSLTDSSDGVTFNMINDGTTSGASNNYWMGGGSQNGNPTIEIPIGIFGVSDVWTMLNADLAGSPGKEAWISFDFGTSSNASSQSIILKLSNSANSSTPTGQIQNAVSCQVGCSGSNAGANGPTLATSNGIMVAAPPNASYTTSNINIVTNQLYSMGYNTGGYGTSGNVVLDDQGFVFNGSVLSLALNSYLVDIKIYEPSASGVSYVGLSAITVDSATPEPSTLAMGLSSLVLICGVIAYRRRKTAEVN